MESSPASTAPRSLSQVLLRRLLLSWLVFMLLFCALQLFFEYHRVRQEIAQNLNTLSETFAPGLESALWDYQENVLQAMVKGIGSHPSVAMVEIHADKPVAGWNNGDPVSPELATVRGLQYRDGSGKQRILGHLRIASSEKLVFARLQQTLLNTIVSNAAQLAFWGLLLWVSTRSLVVKPLTLFANQVGRLIEEETRNKAASLTDVQLGSIPIHEIDSLQQAFKRLMRLLHESRSQIAEQNSNLEQIVATRTREAEQARSVAEAANRAKSEFLANMSHEIRTPMNAVLGMTRLVMESPLQPQQKDYLQKAYAASRALLGILNDILDYSKIEAGRLQIESVPMQIEGILHNLAALFAPQIEAKGLEIAIDLSPDIPPQVLSDPLRFTQILNNLLGNAIKFTERGEIALKLELLPPAPDADPDCLLLRCAVRDTGIGMDAETCSRLFQAFSQADNSITRRYGGTGLGLSISQQLVQLMGGSIHVSSAPGVGSTFTFTVQMKKLEGVQAAHPHDVQQLGSLRVLVVDDHETSRLILLELLQAWGMQAQAVPSGEDALARLAEGEQYDVLLLDWRMPGLDGLAVARAVQEECHPAPPLVFMVTAHDQSELKQEMEQMPGGVALNGILAKPVTPSYLLDALLDARGLRERHQGKDEISLGLVRLDGLQVLLAEDNLINQEVAAAFLRELGVQVKIANNGLEAVQQVQAQYFDLVLMDLHMPVMDGFAAARAILQLPQPAPPIIAMTAAVLPADRQRCQEAGMCDFVGKPVMPEELAMALSKWGMPRLLQRHAAQQPPPVPGPGPEAVQAVPHSAPPAHGLLPPELPGFALHQARERLAQNEELLHTLLQQFVRDEAGCLQELQQTLDQGQTEQTLQRLHALRGVAANLGVQELAQKAAQLEHALRQAKAGHADWQQEWDSFAASLEHSLQTLRRIFSAASSPQENAPDLQHTQLQDCLRTLLPLLREQKLVAESSLDLLRQYRADPAIATLLMALEVFDYQVAVDAAEHALRKSEA